VLVGVAPQTGEEESASYGSWRKSEMLFGASWRGLMELVIWFQSEHLPEFGRPKFGLCLTLRVLQAEGLR